MTDLNLRAVVRDALDTTDLRDPGEIADKVFADLQGEDYGPALRQTLRGFVRVMMGEARRTPHDDSLDGQYSTDNQARCAVEGTDTAPTKASPATIEHASARPLPSRKVAAIRSHWQTVLRHREHVAGGWKLLGECTRDDLLFMVSERQQLASQNTAVAARYYRLADLLVAHGAKTVADLPDNVLADAIGGTSS